MCERGVDHCEVCGWVPPEDILRRLNGWRTRHNSVLEAHHIIPCCEGGTDEEANLVVLCPNHHAIADAVNRGTGVSAPRTKADLVDLLYRIDNDPDSVIKGIERYLIDNAPSLYLNV